ncbi:MAG: AraC family transcriptional regulator [Clostridia bacterium]|nr:AraC family transcriptional regulator [Clostridia bacterium]
MLISHERIITDRPLVLNSCGRQELADRDRVCARRSGRGDYHILYILQGRCYATFEGKEQQIGAGNLILYRPYEPHFYRFFAADRPISLYLHFSGSECEGLLARFGLDQSVTEIGVSDRLESIFYKLQDEYILKKPFCEEVCAGLLMQFLAAAGRKLQEHNTAPLYPGKGIDQACQMMHRHFFENHPIAFYADFCHLSESRFSHAFKARTGLSPQSYIARMRAEIAIDLLETSDLSLSEIARSVGIEDSNYFSRFIKKQTGHTPSFYRNAE